MNAVIEHETELSREQWLEVRKKGIGGSEAAAVLGLNPWMTNVDLWEIKTGRKDAPDIGGKEYVRYGIDAEAPLRELFALSHPEYETHYRPNDIRFSAKHPFLFSSLDGWLVEKSTGECGVLEIKTTNIFSSMTREKWNDRIPDTYYIQVLHAMNVNGWGYAKLKAALQSKWDSEIRETHRHYTLLAQDHKDDMETVLEKTCHFWEYNVQRDIRPNLILPQI